MARTKLNVNPKSTLLPEVRERLERTLDTLVDFEPDVRHHLAKRVLRPNSVSDVCEALRSMIEDTDD